MMHVEHQRTVAPGRFLRERIDRACADAPPAGVFRYRHDELCEGSSVGVVQEWGLMDMPPGGPDRPPVVG